MKSSDHFMSLVIQRSANPTTRRRQGMQGGLAEWILIRLNHPNLRLDRFSNRTFLRMGESAR
jgi:hypothetical protein